MVLRAGGLACWGAGLLIVGLVYVWPAHAGAQVAAEGDRVITTVRAALAPALPFPDTDDSGSVPADGSPVPAWMVRPLQPGERSIEVLANPLNEVNQARAMRAMAQIGVAIDAAQRRAELQYERAVAEAKRTGRSQDVDGVGLSDEGLAGARIDAEAHVTIDVDFNQRSYVVGVESSVAPAPSRSVVIAGAVAIITVPPNVFRVKSTPRIEEKFSPAEAVVFLGALGTPEVRERSENAYDLVALADPAQRASLVRTIAVRLRGNEVLIADILRKTDWTQVLELLK